MFQPVDTPAQWLKALRFIHLAMIIGVIAFMGVSAFLVQEEGTGLSAGELSSQLPIVGGFVGLSLIVLAYYLPNTLFFSKIYPKEELARKLNGFRKGHLIRLVMLETTALINIVFYLLIGHTISLVFALIALGLMLFYLPNPDKVGNALKLTFEEIQLLRGK